MAHQREQRNLTAILGGWAAASIVTGATAWRIGTSRRRVELASFGRQFMLWGLVDGAIAAAGTLRSGSPDDGQQQTQRLRRILIVNAGLDVLYLAAGARLILRQSAPTQRLNRGDGVAIAAQGAFLLALDTTFAARLSPPTPIGLPDSQSGD